MIARIGDIHIMGCVVDRDTAAGDPPPRGFLGIAVDRRDQFELPRAFPGAGANRPAKGVAAVGGGDAGEEGQDS